MFTAVGVDYYIYPVVLEFASDARPRNRLHGDKACFYVNAYDDHIKEDAEKFKARLSSKDPAVCFCKDIMLFSILEDRFDGTF